MGVEKVENDTSENTMDIIKNKQHANENEVRLDQHDVSFDNEAQELNETAEMLLKQDEEIKESLNETSVLLMKSDETLSDDISGVGDRVDTLENTAVLKCSENEDCGDHMLCYKDQHGNGWCSYGECQESADCLSSELPKCIFGLCMGEDACHDNNDCSTTHYPTCRSGLCL